MLFTVITFIIVLAILVFIHEGGHFLAARHVGVRVQRFSIGFPPRMFGRKFGETEYVFSWIPLGGYVKLEGQNIDDENPRDPRNYAAKSIAQRCYILVAGPAANLLLALILMPFVFMLGVETPTYRQAPADIVETTPDSIAAKAGFLPGDRIEAVGEVATASWNAVFREVMRQAVQEDTVTLHTRRGGETIGVVVQSAPFIEGGSIGWQPLIAPVAGMIGTGTPAEAAGFQPGDLLVSMDGRPITRWDEIRPAVQQSKGAPISVLVERQGRRVPLTVTAGFDKQRGAWIIGISPGTTSERHGVLESFRLGTMRLWEITASTFIFLGRLVTGHGSMDALGGPVKIGIVVGEAARAGAANLIFLMAIISLQLGIFNLLPIPALDGGHIFMLGLELVKGGPLSARLRERAQMIGFSLLILLILLVTYNDILQLVT